VTSFSIRSPEKLAVGIPTAVFYFLVPWIYAGETLKLQDFVNGVLNMIKRFDNQKHTAYDRANIERLVPP